MLKKFEDPAKFEENQKKQRVFVVHGRNEELRKSMFDFLRSIGLKPIEWSQAIEMTGEAAPFIGDVLDIAFLHAQAVIVLLTGDDEARLRPQYHTEKMPDYEKNLTPQARPNVLFEAGLALGRFPKQTIIVEIGDLRPFSDIAGRHVIRLNNSSSSRQDVATRLSMAGCKVDLSGRDWHQTGNFDSTNKATLAGDQPNTIGSVGKKEDFPKLSNISNLSLRDLFFDQYNLNEDQITLMMLMSETSGSGSGPAMYSLRDKLNLSTARVIFLLKDLLEKGLICRTGGTGDISHTHNFKLTDKGTRFLIENNYI